MNKRYLHIALLLVGFICFISPVFAQLAGVQVTKFPQNAQLFARDLATNKGASFTEGTVQKSANLKAMRVRVFRDTVLVQDVIQPIDTNAQSATFKIGFEIPAGLTNYNVELSGIQKNNINIWLKQANEVVAGDVFIVNGQSNALGWIEGDNAADRDPFMRTYFDQFGWREAYGTSVGKWSARLMKNIIEKERVPVAIFNQAIGGEPIQFFLRHPDSPYSVQNNYSILYNRLKTNDLLRGVRGLFWWQGESDGWVTSADSYRIQTKRLFQQWKEDYNNPPVFFYQIRYRACGHVLKHIFETQRQLAAELPNTEIFSNHPARVSDGCHFTYFNGYDSLGNRMYRLVASKLYGKSANFTRPPNIVSAVLLSKTELELSFSQMPTGNLQTNGSFWQDMKLEGTTTAQITGGSASGSKLKLKLSGDTTGLRGISYYGNMDTLGGENRFVANPLMVGVLQFNNFPVSTVQPTAIRLMPTIRTVQLEVFPTISSNHITVSFPEKNEQTATIEIVNLLGEVVRKEKITEGVILTQMDVGFLSKGIYFLRLVVDNQCVSSVKKFVKI